MTRFKDNVHLAQVDDTRAGILLSEGRSVEAEKIARAAVLRLEGGDELSWLAEALTTHGIALARLTHPDEARAAFEHAIASAEKAGDFQRAGIAALTLVEQLDHQLTLEEKCATLDHARTLLEKTENIRTVRRMANSAFHVLFKAHLTPSPPNWEGFSLRRSVHAFESYLINRALEGAAGSVTKAAHLLGFKHHQSLASLIASRHPELLTVRAPVRKRRKHAMEHPKKRRRK